MSSVSVAGPRRIVQRGLIGYALRFYSRINRQGSVLGSVVLRIPAETRASAKSSSYPLGTCARTKEGTLRAPFKYKFEGKDTGIRREENSIAAAKETKERKRRKRNTEETRQKRKKRMLPSQRYSEQLS